MFIRPPTESEEQTRQREGLDTAWNVTRSRPPSLSHATISTYRRASLAPHNHHSLTTPTNLQSECSTPLLAAYCTSDPASASSDLSSKLNLDMDALKNLTGSGNNAEQAPQGGGAGGGMMGKLNELGGGGAKGEQNVRMDNQRGGRGTRGGSISPS